MALRYPSDFSIQEQATYPPGQSSCEQIQKLGHKKSVLKDEECEALKKKTISSRPHVKTIQQNNSYGHRTLKARLPVRSALVKQCIARLVLWWVTTWESLVL
jgi:hypothetical protein